MCHWQDLPPEIRNKIFETYFHKCYVRHKSGSCPSGETKLTDLLCVAKCFLTPDQMLDILLRVSNFTVYSATDAHMLRLALGKTRVNLLRYLELLDYTLHLSRRYLWHLDRRKHDDEDEEYHYRDHLQDLDRARTPKRPYESLISVFPNIKRFELTFEIARAIFHVDWTSSFNEYASRSARKRQNIPLTRTEVDQNIRLIINRYIHVEPTGYPNYGPWKYITYDPQDFVAHHLVRSFDVLLGSGSRDFGMERNWWNNQILLEAFQRNIAVKINWTHAIWIFVHDKRENTGCGWYSQLACLTFDTADMMLRVQYDHDPATKAIIPQSFPNDLIQQLMEKDKLWPKNRV